MNLQSADTYAMESKVGFVCEEPLRASLGSCMDSSLSQCYILSVSSSKDEASLLLDTKLILWMNFMCVHVRHFATSITAESKNCRIKACQCIQTRFKCKCKGMLLLVQSHFSVAKTLSSLKHFQSIPRAWSKGPEDKESKVLIKINSCSESFKTLKNGSLFFSLKIKIRWCQELYTSKTPCSASLLICSKWGLRLCSFIGCV